MFYPIWFLCPLFYSDRVNPCDTHRRPTRFLRIYISRHSAGMLWKGQRDDKREKKKKTHQIPKILHAGRRLMKLLNFEHVLSFMRKIGWLQVGSSGPRRQSLRPQKVIPRPWSPMGFGSNRVCPVGFQNCLGPVTPFFL